MRVRAFINLPHGTVRATSEHMPFAGHRTCAHWIAQTSERQKKPRPDEDELRIADAVMGSNRLKAAILEMARR